jgi:hypothetical protein
LLVAAVAGALAIGIVPALATSTPNKAAATAAAPPETLTNYDARSGGSSVKKVLQARAAQLAAKPSPAVTALRTKVGAQGIVDLDPLTGTARVVGKLDGFLTGPSRSAKKTIALEYLKANAAGLGLSATDVSRLVLRQDYVDIVGTHHLSFVQKAAGYEVFGNGVRVHITRDGRVAQVDGSPVADLPATLGSPGMNATQARDAAAENVFSSRKAAVLNAASGGNQSTAFAGGDTAKLVIFQTLRGPRLAWQTYLAKEGYIHVVDAATGRTLFRQSTIAKDSGQAWANYPGAPAGGTQQTRFFTSNGWIANGSTDLEGNNVHVYLDLNDDDVDNPGEDVGPSGFHKYDFPFTNFNGSDTTGLCSAAFPCSWDQNTAFSWQTNAKQNATQMFYFTNTFHDWLAGGRIGFTAAAGNFEGSDKLVAQALDGANIAGDGFPDLNHIDNANMSTPPDGLSPRMQMYLFITDPTFGEFIQGNSGDEADIVYHEYTHGLSNRLVVDAGGVSTLGNIQAGSMGEAWSDWYAYDFLARKGYTPDVKGTDGDVRVGQYVGAGQDLIRTQPLDCRVGSHSPKCPGALAGQGGYTYGDFGKIIGRPEVHADGEIWGETLWDLRDALGADATESLVTRAMELSPANPSMLDERNAILQADMINSAGANQKKIWKVFANRGMGWFAGAIDGDDASPVEDFSLPPTTNQRGRLLGTVTDEVTGAGLAGINVAFGGHNSGFANGYAAVTDAHGAYEIDGIIPGTYPKVFVSGPGYDLSATTVSVSSGDNVKSWSTRRDWAAAAGGGAITDFNGADFSAFGCGAPALIDQAQGNGWSTDATETAPDHTSGLAIEPRFAVIHLPDAVDITQVFINPSTTCGDAGSSSTGDYTVETSADGTTWHVVSSGHFGPADRNYHAVTLSGGNLTGVNYVRYTMISTQVGDLGGNCPGAFTGCDFVDSSEVGVYGTPST